MHLTASAKLSSSSRIGRRDMVRKQLANKLEQAGLPTYAACDEMVASQLSLSHDPIGEQCQVSTPPCHVHGGENRQILRLHQAPEHY
jgi:hypothetical protein